MYSFVELCFPRPILFDYDKTIKTEVETREFLLNMSFED